MWEPFSNGDEHYQILQPEVEMAKDFKADAMRFWSEKLRGIRKQDANKQDTDTEHDEL